MSKRHLFRFESKHRPVLDRKAFAGRMAYSIAAGGALIGLSLFAGILGYHLIEGMAWLDAFVNASMILGGMGPVDQLHTSAGKIFAGCYALYSGLVLILATGIVLAPMVHRVLHRFHVESEAD